MYAVSIPQPVVSKAFAACSEYKSCSNRSKTLFFSPEKKMRSVGTKSEFLLVFCVGTGNVLAEARWVWFKECGCYCDGEILAWPWGAHHIFQPWFPLEGCCFMIL